MSDIPLYVSYDELSVCFSTTTLLQRDWSNQLLYSIELIDSISQYTDLLDDS